jgi:putative membrane protein
MSDMGSMMGGMGAWMAVWLVLGLALTAAVVVGVVVLLQRSNRDALRSTQRPPDRAVESAREVLRRRYAAGEIDEDEYFRRMSGLAQD